MQALSLTSLVKTKTLYAYLRLMRLDKPVGIWLLLWPTLGALWLAAPKQPSWTLIGAFTAGTLCMRSFGCVINDIADRNIDGHVPRTQARVLVQKQLSLKQAFSLAFLLLLLSALCLWCLPFKTLLPLCATALFLATLYPFAKRFTPLPQAFLGAAFAMGIPMACSARLGFVPTWSWLLYLATLLWVIAYDTEYALVDRPADRKMNIRSSAIFFGTWVRFWVGCLLLGAWLCFAALGALLNLGPSYWIAELIIAGLMVQQIHWLGKEDPQFYFRAFLQNQWLGLIFFLGIICQGDKQAFMLFPN